jgi:transcriptional regulator with GAF, ATPase, and Fis domain
MIRSSSDTLVLDDGLGKRYPTPAPGDKTLEGMERRHILDVLRKCSWRINGVGNAAEQLGLHPNTLRFRMKKLGITREAAPSLCDPKRQKA